MAEDEDRERTEEPVRPRTNVADTHHRLARSSCRPDHPGDHLPRTRPKRLHRPRLWRRLPAAVIEASDRSGQHAIERVGPRSGFRAIASSDLHRLPPQTRRVHLGCRARLEVRTSTVGALGYHHHPCAPAGSRAPRTCTRTSPRRRPGTSRLERAGAGVVLGSLDRREFPHYVTIAVDLSRDRGLVLDADHEQDPVARERLRGSSEDHVEVGDLAVDDHREHAPPRPGPRLDPGRAPRHRRAAGLGIVSEGAQVPRAVVEQHDVAGGGLGGGGLSTRLVVRLPHGVDEREVTGPPAQFPNTSPC